MMQLWHKYYNLITDMNKKQILLGIFILLISCARAQKIDNIHVNLYTDSLKKGTFNYINIDGHLTNGSYLPLDSTDITFWSNEGKFYGNSLWIDKEFNKEKVLIKVVLKKNPSLSREFTMYIKKNPDNEKLKTSEELMNELGNYKKVKRKNR